MDSSQHPRNTTISRFIHYGRIPKQTTRIPRTTHTTTANLNRVSTIASECEYSKTCFLVESDPNKHLAFDTGQCKLYQSIGQNGQGKMPILLIACAFFFPLTERFFFSAGYYLYFPIIGSKTESYLNLHSDNNNLLRRPALR
jgi:hypothetical protein